MVQNGKKKVTREAFADNSPAYAVFSNKNNSVVPVRTVIWENPTAGKYSNIKISLGGIASEDDFDMSGSLYSNGYADSSTSSTMK